MFIDNKNFPTLTHTHLSCLLLLLPLNMVTQASRVAHPKSEHPHCLPREQQLWTAIPLYFWTISGGCGTHTHTFWWAQPCLVWKQEWII